ncbi:MAG TPA: GNAT family protein [Candidatus Limnocylindrales bacterium]|jgi:RimJ/RimL family protein N-acetyltransferase
MAHLLWPLYDLRLRTERLELRLPDEAEIGALCRLAKAGIHPPGEMPFGVAWTTKPSPPFEREFIQWHWKQRADWTPEAWSLELAVFLDGRPIGSQTLAARQLATFRSVSTGSWLGLEYQRRGLGKEMRGAVLALAFDGLAAEVATTEAFLDNPASAGVSRSLGYRPNGTGSIAPEGVARETERFRMTRADWLSRSRPAVEIEGLESSREMFGA